MKPVEEPKDSVCGDYFVNREYLIFTEAPLVPALSDFVYEAFKKC